MQNENTPAAPSEPQSNPPANPPATPPVPAPATPAEQPKPAAPTPQETPQQEAPDLQNALTERDSHKTRADAAETELRRYRVKDAFGAAVSDAKTGIRNPKAVQAMLNTDRITVEKNDKGEEVVKGLAEELTRIKGEFPEFFFAVPGSADAAAGATPANTPGEKLDGNAWLFNALTRR